jgi:hypothetical protein
MRFSAGRRNPRAKAHFQNRIFFRWTEVQLPLLKQGAPTESFPVSFPQALGLRNMKPVGKNL